MKMKAESQIFWINQIECVFFPPQFETAVQISKLVLYYGF